MLITVAVLVYLGMLIGGIPGLKVDRTGIALLGAIVLIVIGETTPQRAIDQLDIPTLVLLFSMMVLSAQLQLGGFYDAVVQRLGTGRRSPLSLLAVIVLVAAALSAVFTNDVIALAMAPVLIQVCRARGLPPLPFLLALACATNVGSAAMLIGNPQNILIGQTLGIDFARYTLVALPPTVLGLLAVVIVIRIIHPAALEPHSLHGSGESIDRAERETGRVSDHVTNAGPPFDRWHTAKGLVLAAALLLAFFFTGLPREGVALAAAGIILLSRRFHTRALLGLVDWELLVLFAGLFIVNGTLLESGLMSDAQQWLAGRGIDAAEPATLFLITPVLSIAVSNVPAVMLLLPFATHPLAGPVLALASTLAGNALIIGSIANIIVVEQAGRAGIRITWRDHARVGLPITLASLAFAALVLALSS